MATRRGATLEDLRTAIERLPRHTRVAMLEGIDASPIIVGAYATGDGVCPMLAAHRAGGRTDAIAFAQAWDRVAFRNVRRARHARARRATERELLILRAHLEASLLEDELPGAAMPPARREQQPPPGRDAQPAAIRPGDPDRAPELGDRPGWAWIRVVRRYDDYERVLARVEQAHAPETSEPAATR
jgi:hypothetical protein